MEELILTTARNIRGRWLDEGITDTPEEISKRAEEKFRYSTKHLPKEIREERWAHKVDEFYIETLIKCFEDVKKDLQCRK